MTDTDDTIAEDFVTDIAGDSACVVTGLNEHLNERINTTYEQIKKEEDALFEKTFHAMIDPIDLPTILTYARYEHKQDAVNAKLATLIYGSGICLFWIRNKLSPIHTYKDNHMREYGVLFTNLGYTKGREIVIIDALKTKCKNAGFNLVMYKQIFDDDTTINFMISLAKA
jgi:hypothetical protein